MSFPSPAFDESQFLATPSPFERVTIIGAGLIGGSFAWLMRERFSTEKLHITLVDKDEKTLQLALRKGIANVAQQSLPDAFEGSHLVVLATHLTFPPYSFAHPLGKCRFSYRQFLFGRLEYLY